MKILIIGANGQLGKELCQQLHEFEVVEFTKADFDFACEDDFFIEDQYDYIINAMAFTNTGLCEEQPLQAYFLNSIRVGEIAKAANETGATLIHFSTDYVFDGNSYKPYEEIDRVRPMSIYGSSKLAGEYEALMYCPKTYVFRVSSLYGIHGNNFVKAILEKAQNNEKLKIVGDQTMSPTHTLDVAKMVKHFIQNKIEDYGIYHSSNNGKCTWAGFTETFLKYAGLPHQFEEVSWKSFPSKLRRPIDSSLNVEKLKKYYEMPPWQNSLKEFISIWKEDQ